MFTRCRSLSAAEEIKVKQKQGRERQSRGKEKQEEKRWGDKEGEGGEEGRGMQILLGCAWWGTHECQGCFVRMWEVCNQSQSNVLLHSAALRRGCTCTSTYYTKYTADAPQWETTHSQAGWMCHDSPAGFRHGYTINAEHRLGDKHHETNELFDIVIFLNVCTCPPRLTRRR